MCAVVRTYSGQGAAELFDLLGQREEDVKESSRRAAEWVKENVSATADPPVITEGDTVLQFSS